MSRGEPDGATSRRRLRQDVCPPLAAGSRGFSYTARIATPHRGVPLLTMSGTAETRRAAQDPLSHRGKGCSDGLTAPVHAFRQSRDEGTPATGSDPPTELGQRGSGPTLASAAALRFGPPGLSSTKPPMIPFLTLPAWVFHGSEP
jgi:hypothetical protein